MFPPVSKWYIEKFANCSVEVYPLSKLNPTLAAYMLFRYVCLGARGLTGILQQTHGRSRYFFGYVVVVHAAAPYQTPGAEVDRSTAAQNAANAEAALEFRTFVLARLRYH